MRRSSDRFATALLLLLLAGVARADRGAPPGSTRAIRGADAAATSPRDRAPTRAYAVPEPGTFLLMSIGGVGLLGYRWRRRMLDVA